MDFSAIDVETANPDLASICQVGLVTFKNGEVMEKWQSLVDPQDYFDAMNVSIHDIDEDDVYGAPVFADIYHRIKEAVAERVVVCHTHFDRVAVGRACMKSNGRGAFRTLP